MTLVKKSQFGPNHHKLCPQVIDLQLTEVPSEKKKVLRGDPKMAERERGVDQ